jgi:hypothetical protein
MAERVANVNAESEKVLPENGDFEDQQGRSLCLRLFAGTSIFSFVDSGSRRFGKLTRRNHKPV